MTSNILLLADTGHVASAVSDHIRAITQNSPFHWVVENPLLQKTLHKVDLASFDAIGIHYSLKAHLNYYLPTKLRHAIQHFNGVKFMFLQDEHRFGDSNIATLQTLNIHLLFTLVTPPYYENAYPAAQLPHLKKVTVLTAYAPSSLKTIAPIPIADRTLDIFYRSREFPFWLGELAQERIIIADEVQQRAKAFNLRTNISVKETDRIYGNAWIQTVRSSRAVLGTESGASVWDKTGNIEQEVKAYLQKNPNAPFKVVQIAVLQPYEGKIFYATISPRVFEAAALRTAMILFPGYYNGILLPDVHYIPLNKDFSNFDDVVKKLKNDSYLENMVEKTYQDLIASGQYDQSLLASTVTDELALLLATPARESLKKETFHDVQSKIDVIKKRYRYRNIFYCFLAESQFIVTTFLALVFDKQHTGKDKVDVLWHGAKRYITYITARVRSFWIPRINGGK
jgi:hypothetical protein